MLTDEQIFDILDGIATAETKLLHNHLLANSLEYLAHFQEMEALHFDLTHMTIEQPSPQFTENILANIQWKTVSVKKKPWSYHLTSIFFGVMASIFFATITFTLIYFPATKTTIETPPSYWLELTNTFLTDTFVRVAILGNLLILLVIFDKKVLKPHFNHRKITLN